MVFADDALADRDHLFECLARVVEAPFLFVQIAELVQRRQYRRVFGTELADGRLTVRVAEFGGFTRAVARVARDAGVSLYEVAPTDDSLESVFAYLVSRR